MSKCFDYGNAERDDKDDGPGTMETLSFGNKTAYWKRQPANGTGPWLMADLEKGMYPGDDNVDPDALPTLGFPYVTGFLKGRTCDLVLKAGDATKGGAPMRLYDGRRPEHAAYEPPNKQGAIILGTGGDNSRHAMGTFFEGAIATGSGNQESESSQRNPERPVSQETGGQRGHGATRGREGGGRRFHHLCHYT